MWIYLVISLVVGVASLYGIALGLSKMQKQLLGDSVNPAISEGTRFWKAFTFIFGLIVVQGSKYHSES